ncbi:MAG: WD40 repeat domain-containing protein [Vulcanimicrobiota bacterium]
MSERLVIRAGHAYTQELGLRPDGLILATLGSQQAGIHFWETRGGRPLGVWHGQGRLQGFLLSQDRLLSWGEGRACLWDCQGLHHGQLDFPLLKDYVNAEGVSLDSRNLLLGGSPVRLVNSRTGKVRAEFPKERWIHVGPRGRRLVLGNRLISGISGREVYQFENACARAAFSPEERWLAVAGYSDCFLTLMDLDRSQTFRHEAHRHRIVALQFSPDGLYLASLDEQGWVTVVDLEKGHSQVQDCQLEGVNLLGWLGRDRLVVGDGSGAYRLLEVTPDLLRASTVVPGPLVTENGVGRWVLGAEGQAAWALGPHVSIRHLASGQMLGCLPSPLRGEPRVRQQLVGQTVLVEGQPWDLHRGKPLSSEPYAALGQHLLARRGEYYILDEQVSLPIPIEVPHLRAVCARLRSFVFSDSSGRRLEIWRGQGEQCSRWRTAPELACNPQGLQFNAGGQLLSWHDGQGHTSLWLPEVNRLVACPGPIALLPQGWVECDASGQVQLRDLQGQVRRQLAGGNPWAWVFQSQEWLLLVAPRRAEVWDQRLETRLVAWELPGLSGAVLTEDGQCLAGIESSGDVSMWKLPDGRLLGPPQPFHPQDLPHLKFVSGHGLALACAGKECGCWFLREGRFEWLRFGEPWFSGVHPLPGGQVLLLTQDGAWHLYGGRPLQRLASLSTANNGGWLVLSQDGRWDSNPDLYTRVVLPSGRQPPAPEDSLWERFICGPTSLPADDPAA